MNNSSGTQRDIKIDLVDLLWKLLMQWKAILLVCVVMGLLVPGAKYLKDMSVYKAELAAKKDSVEQSSIPTAERIDAVLSTFPVDQQNDILFVVQQQELVNSQKEYLANSILLNLDPSRQRQLAISYVLRSDSGTNMRALADSYSVLLRSSNFLEGLRDIIDPETSLDYIDELVDTENKYISGGSTSSALYTVKIILPEDIIANDVLNLVDAVFNDNHEMLTSTVGEHTISNAGSSDCAVFNEDIFERRRDITFAINNLNSSLGNAKSSFSDEQQAAYEAIIAIKNSADNNPTATAQDAALSPGPLKPGFSKKYLLLGFMLGLFLYAGVYVVLLILRKIVASVSTAQSFTGTRILGEVYIKAAHAGLSRLLTSNVVARWRYKDKLNVDNQIASLVATVDALCAHYSAGSVTLVLSDVDDSFHNVIDRIVKECGSECNKNISVITSNGVDERVVSSINTAIYAICSETKIDHLEQLLSLCDAYDIKQLGTIYLEKL